MFLRRRFAEEWLHIWISASRIAVDSAKADRKQILVEKEGAIIQMSDSLHFLSGTTS
jgi:hypothetical protein